MSVRGMMRVFTLLLTAMISAQSWRVNSIGASLGVGSLH
jgi:hypothetical protein